MSENTDEREATDKDEHGRDVQLAREQTDPEAARDEEGLTEEEKDARERQAEAERKQDIDEAPSIGKTTPSRTRTRITIGTRSRTTANRVPAAGGFSDHLISSRRRFFHAPTRSRVARPERPAS